MEQENKDNAVVDPTEYISLCHYVVRRMIRGTLSTRCRLQSRYYDDYIGVASEALVEASRAFNPEKYGTTFTTFAVTCIINKLILFQKRFVTKKSVLLVKSFTDRKIITHLIEDDDLLDASQKFPLTIAELAIDLPPNYRTVIQGIMAGKQLSEIGRENNLSRQRIHQIYHKAIEMMRCRAKSLTPSEFEE